MKDMTNPKEGTRFRRFITACTPDLNLIFLKLHYLLFFAGQAILLPHIPMLQKHLGLSELECSAINGSMPFMAFFAVYGISALADKLRNHRTTLIAMCALCAIAHLLLNIVPGKPIQSQMSSTDVMCTDGVLNLRSGDIDVLFSTNTTVDDLLECSMKCPGDYVSFRDHDMALSHDQLEFRTELMRPIVYGNTSKPEVTTKITDVFHEGLHHTDLMCSNEGNLTCTMECQGPVIDSGPDFSHTFGIFFLVYFIGYMFYSPCTCLCDALAYQALPKREYEWGNQRAFGTIGFTIASALGGFLQEYTRQADGRINYDYNVYLFSGLILLAAIAAIFIKLPERKEHKVRQVNADDEQPYDESQPDSTSFRSLVTDVRVWTLVTAMLLFGLNFGLVFAFLFWYMDELQMQAGYETQTIVMGLALFVAGVMELLFMVISGYIIKKLGEINCLIVAFLSYALKFLLYSQLGLLGSIWWVLAIETLYGPSFGLMFAAATTYANRISPPGMQATLQGLASGFHFNIGWGVGALLGGVIYKTIGGSYMFLSFSGLSLFAAACLALTNALVLHKQEQGEHLKGGNSISNLRCETTEGLLGDGALTPEPTLWNRTTPQLAFLDDGYSTGSSRLSSSNLRESCL